MKRFLLKGCGVLLVTLLTFVSTLSASEGGLSVTQNSPKLDFSYSSLLEKSLLPYKYAGEAVLESVTEAKDVYAHIVKEVVVSAKEISGDTTASLGNVQANLFGGVKEVSSTYVDLGVTQKASVLDSVRTGILKFLRLEDRITVDNTISTSTTVVINNTATSSPSVTYTTTSSPVIQNFYTTNSYVTGSTDGLSRSVRRSSNNTSSDISGLEDRIMSAEDIITQLEADFASITPFSSSTARALFSSISPELTYDNVTGIFALDLSDLASSTNYFTKTGNDLTYTDGLVGIGTLTPTYTLDVVGSFRATGPIDLGTTTITGALTVAGNTYITNGGELNVGDKIVAPGEIGIGTSTPGSKLAIQNTIANQTAFSIYGTSSSQTAPLLDVYSSPATNVNYFRISADGAVKVGDLNGLVTASNGTLSALATSSLGLFTDDLTEGANLFYTDQRVADYINASSTLGASLNYFTKSGSNLYYTGGNVGVGTTSPAAKLALTTGAITTKGFLVQGASGQTANLAEFVDGVNATLMSIGPAGTIGIGAAPNTSFQLDVSNPTRAGFRFTSGTRSLYFSNFAADVNYLFASGAAFRLGTSDGNNVEVWANNARNAVFSTTGQLFMNATGTAALPSFSFFGDQNTGFYSSGNDTVNFAANGTNVLGATVNGLNTRDGSASVPGYGFIADFNTGMFRPDTDALGFSTGGTERLRVDASGNVGIGTTTPGTRLSNVSSVSTINGNANSSAFTWSVNATDEWAAVIQNISGTRPNGLLINAPATASPNGELFQIASGGTSKFLVTGGGTVQIGSTTNITSPGLLTIGGIAAGTSEMVVQGVASQNTSILRVQDSSQNPYLIVNHNGNVGIGTTTPSSKLSVVGDIFTTNQVLASSSATAPSFAIAGDSDTGFTYGNNRFAFMKDGTNVFFVDTLIGYVYTNYRMSGISGSASNASFGHLNSGGTGMFFPSIGSLALTTNSTERLRIDSAGNVGIGSTTPYSTLSVTGNPSTVPFTVASSSGNSLLSLTQAGQVLTGGGSATAPTYSFGNDTNTGMYSSFSDGLEFTTAGVRRMEITGSFIRGVIAFAGTAGNAGTPGYTFFGDSDNGMFSPTTNMLGFSTAGVERIRIDASGNVGIGTTTAEHQLSLTGNFQIPVTSTTTGTVGVIYQGALPFIHSIGTSNLFMGKNAGNLNTSGAGGNVGMGEEALYGITTGTKNIGIGYQAGKSLTTPQGNVAIGYNALSTSVDGANNFALGVQALQYVTGSGNSSNVALGTNAMRNPTSAISSVAIGGSAAQGNTGSSITYSVAIGNGAMGPSSMVSVDKSVAIGDGALGGVTTAANNIAIGRRAGLNLTTGSSNIVIGTEINLPSATASGQMSIGNIIFGTGNSTTGTTIATGNIGIGTSTPSQQLSISKNFEFPATATTSGTVGVIYQEGAPFIHTLGFRSLYIGELAGNLTNSSNYNLAIGSNSLRSVTTGSQNTAIGSLSLQSLTTGAQNFGLGVGAGNTITSGSYNTAIGTSALYRNSIGSNNLAIGRQAVYSTTGSNNVGVGLQALNGTATASYSNNTAVGTNALVSVGAGGNGNVAIGYQAGYTDTIANALTTGTNNVFIGMESGFSTVTQRTNAIAIGYRAKVDADNALILGGTGANAVSVGIGTTSPGYKLHVVGDDGAGNVAKFETSGGLTSCTLDAGTGLLNCSSDERLKKDIENLNASTSLEKILELRPVSYLWKTESASSSLKFGFIAQEMEEIFPELVQTDKQTGYKSVGISGLIPFLVDSMQEIVRNFADLANLLKTKEVQTDKLCLEDVCITKTELSEILQGQGTPSSPSTPEPEEPEPTPEVPDTTPEETPEGNGGGTPPEEIPEEVPENPEPEVEETPEPEPESEPEPEPQDEPAPEI